MFEELEARRARLDRYRPFPAAIQRSLDQLFEPWFIFSSNAIEGNTLTLGDTIYLLQRDTLPPGGKRLDEVLEVKGQESAYRYLQESVSGKFQLSEKLIREFHELLTGRLENADTKYAPGRYKTRDNQVKVADGSVFPYVSAFETPAAMEDLIAWYAGPAQALHPIERAARLHYKFILIHPFLDGNGRTVRLLANLALLQAGYVMVVFRAQEREKRLIYLNALREADTSVPLVDLHPGNEAIDVSPFTSYVEQELLWSYEMALDVVEGRLAVTAEDLVRRFEGLDERILSARGIIGDAAARTALLAERVESLTRRASQYIRESATAFNSKWKSLDLVVGDTVEGPNFLASPRYQDTYQFNVSPLRHECLGLEAIPERGSIGTVTLAVRPRPGSAVLISVPPNRCELLVASEPHRLTMAYVFAADTADPWQSERIHLPLDPASWGPQVEAFLNLTVNRFLNAAEASLLRRNPPPEPTP